VDISYLVPDLLGEYCVAAGGRCYKERDIYEGQLAMVKCPVCKVVVKDQWAYEQHYHACHTKEML
jgi:demethoxyubiquinone hydroxylase (CLK1/Coq7/Cat5 family)